MSKHILIVDDEANIRELLELSLGAQGFRVTGVDSAKAALALARSDPPQLIISDLQLTDSDGLEMIAKLKSLLPNTPVILLTGVLFDQKVVSEVLESKVACYLPKTTTLAQIVETVRRLTGT